MAKKKYEVITELYARAVREVSAKPGNWMAFLNSACRNYRLPFDEQLLVHMQRPGATAVLRMEDWNRKFGRWVRRDAKGIAVIDKKAKTIRLKYYFDISDTQEGKYKRLVRPVPLWEVTDSQREQVRETLANAYGVSGETKDFAATIMEAAGNLAEDNLADYMPDILSGRENSFLEEMDEYNIEVRVKKLLGNSAAYMLMVRCGIDPGAYLDADDFRGIMEFNTPALVNLFGAAASDIAQMALGEVADTVRKLLKEKDKGGRTFAVWETGRYNGIEDKEYRTETERSPEYENDRIQQARRLSPAQHHSAGRTGTTPWEIRFPTPQVSGRTPLWAVHRPPDAGEAEPAFDGNAGGGTPEAGTDNVTNGGRAGNDGRTESKRPDGVAARDEQYPPGGRGNSDERADLQLTPKEPEPQANGDLSVEGMPVARLTEGGAKPQAGGGPAAGDMPAELEWHDRSSEDKSLPFFWEDEDIKSLLLSTPHLKADKEEIRAFFERHEDRKEQAEYVKGIFNNEYTEVTLEDGRRLGYKTYQNVLHMWEGSYLSRTSQSYFDWGVIAGYFEGMRLLGELKDRMKPLATVEGQLNFLEDLAGGKASAFSFSQEVVDAVIKSGSRVSDGKYRIYSYFLKNHTVKEKADFLKNEYGFIGAYPAIIGTGIDMLASGKGMRISKNGTEILLKWGEVAKRIDGLIAAGRYMTEKELERLPEYEKAFLTAEIYHFFHNQPEEVARPYPYGSEYHVGVKAIRPQIDSPERAEEILSVMAEVLDNTADSDRHYKLMKRAYRDLTDYRDGKFSLFTPELDGAAAHAQPVAGAGQPKSQLDALAEKICNFYYDSDIYAGIETWEGTVKRIKEQLSDPKEIMAVRGYLEKAVGELGQGDEEYPMLKGLLEEVEGLPAMDTPYDIHVDTVVSVGMKEYSIEFLSDDAVMLRDMEYPLFTEEMTRGEFERKLRENPANDHLKIKRLLPEPPAEKKNRELLPISETPETNPQNKVEKQLSESESGLAQEQEEQPETERVTQAGLAPAWEKKKTAGRIRGFDLHPEIPQEQRNQYRIANDELGHGTQKEKFRANIAAIRLLKKCEDEDRYATPDEQEVLSGYVGWGGLADVFDETKPAWGYEYLELKTVLTQEEYASARQSTLTAFYTPPVVIRAIYQALENMGLKSGNILEPSCAVGNFIGMKPESLSGCKVYGVEIDPISGKIAQQLYQKSTIAVQGYEETALPDSFFDAAVGNVPFGRFKVFDKRYDRHNFLVHDYFFAKTLDKVRPGGVVAFLTSSGTMDKKNPAIRKYIAQRAELLGAIRLPNDTFKKNAGTEVTSDILFLQKRDRMAETEPDWLYLDTDGNGITQNRYFVEHPEMVLGEMGMESMRSGMDGICRPYENASLESLLAQAVGNIHAEIAGRETEGLVEGEDDSIPAIPSVANFSFTVCDGKIYYRENSRMKPVELSVTGEKRVKGMVAIRDCARELIAFQAEGYADTVIEGQQRKLGQLYDTFQEKYGLLNARANRAVFADDNSYPLLCSLEVVAEDGTLERKADMFTKRTMKPHEAASKVDTASEALLLSLSEKARVDMGYMCQLTGKTAGEIEQELTGVIFRLPDVKGAEPQFVSEDEYLSGNVREKLKNARIAAQSDKSYETNVEALEKVQPKDLSASEIGVRLGATWIPTADIADFMFGLLETPDCCKRKIKVHFSKATGEWMVEGKNNDKGNIKANNVYGTHRANAYRIIEDTLNLRDTRIFDYEVDEGGKRKAILNKKETAIAQGKQDLIKQAFTDWIWRDPGRRHRLTAYYNENFNAVRPREYDGSHLNFYGMNPEIKLRQHQKNGAARIIYGGNTLLAYVVGAGKTYTMAAAAMECKRLGLCNKSMAVVPNHIVEQFAAEWLQLYPAANLLVATKKDFEMKNRRKFCARIATSDIDAVIIGHSQFERIPLSVERQQRMLQKQIDEVMDGIMEGRLHKGDRFTVKELEKMKMSLEAKLKKLNDQGRKDDVVSFEELGIDRLFVDEADSYKNLYLFTKMRNVGGIAQTEAQKSSDMFMKCQYLDELTGGKGVVFATGTPVSNSIVELYTMQRYLQYNTLAKNRLQHFDAWASTFGETVTAIDIACQL